MTNKNDSQEKISIVAATNTNIIARLDEATETYSLSSEEPVLSNDLNPYHSVNVMVYMKIEDPQTTYDLFEKSVNSVVAATNTNIFARLEEATETYSLFPEENDLLKK